MRYVTGPVDLTRMQPVSHGSIGMRRVGSGQEVFEISRVGSGRLNKFSNLAGRVGSGQQLFKSRGSGRVGSGGSENIAGQIGSGGDIKFFHGSGQVTRPDPTREV